MQSGDSQDQKERPLYLMSWSNDVILEFLELYRAEQLLWDPKHPLHRNRPEVADAWIRIQTALSIDVSVTDLKRKKESLMTSFRMHLNKKKSQESYTTNWFAYTTMESFLGVKYECDSTNYLDPEFFGSGSGYTQPGEREKNVRQRPSSCQGNIKIRTADPSIEIPDFLVVKKQVDEAVTSLKRATTATTNSLVTQKKDQDEYDLYGQLLAKKMRKLDERQRDLVMHEIDNIMYRAKMKSDSQTCRISQSPDHRKVSSPVFISLGQNQDAYEHATIQYEEIHPPS